MALILHLVSQADWDAQKDSGFYRAESLESEGFIHFSTQEQAAGSANRYYIGRDDLLLLVVDTDKLTTPLKYEPPRDPARKDERFPHLYGALNVDAVVRVAVYKPNNDGTFEMPEI
jgi:uncharacterized protein (DUF952 family)